VRREALESIVLLMSPMMPHLAETCWEVLGHKTLVVDTPWPGFIEALTKSDTVTIAVQINGKLRATRQMPKDTDKAEVERIVLGLGEVQRALDGKAPKKVIVVPNRIVNIVA
jgi:leucyl-tRNA synthetase